MDNKKISLRDNSFRGILCMITAFFFVALGSALVKEVSRYDLPTPIIVFFESLIPLVVIIIWHCRRGIKKFSVATRHPVWQVTQGIVGFLTSYLLYLAIRSIPTVNGVLLNSSAPLFIPIICYFWFRNRISLKLIIAIAVGFVGIILILKPSASLFDQPGALIALASGIAVAFDDIIVGRLENKEGEKQDITLFYVFLMTTILSGLLAIPCWKTPSGIEWLYLFSIGTAFLGIQLFLILALTLAPVTVVSPFMYFGVVFAGIFDWLFWGLIPGWLTGVGIILVIAGAIYSIVAHPRKHPRCAPRKSG
jgi:drug/metabolite transporter (DMT)-like permease